MSWASRVAPVIRSSAHSLHASNALAGCGKLASRCVSTSSSRWTAATPAASLSPTVSVIVNGKKEPSPRLVQLANDITSLTLLESAELAELLKVRFGLTDADLSFGGGGGGSSSAAAPVEEAKVAAPAAAEKTHFDVKLKSFDAAQKLKVIKEVRAVTGLGLKEAKELVEGAPAVIAKGLKKADGDALIAKLKECGAVLELE